MNIKASHLSIRLLLLAISAVPAILVAGNSAFAGNTSNQVTQSHSIHSANLTPGSTLNNRCSVLDSSESSTVSLCCW